MRIRVLAGAGTGPTELAARDAALCDAGIGNFNLVSLSSVIPPSATVGRVESIPSLGPVAGLLPVVEAAVTVPPGTAGAAALGWARADDGRGLFYEATAEESPEVPDGGRAVPDRDGDALEEQLAGTVREGLAHGFAIRGWGDPSSTVETGSVGDPDSHASLAILAAYGRATSPAETTILG